MIVVLWNMEFNYYKEQPLKSTMVKHKLKIGSSSRAKWMKSRTKDTSMDIKSIFPTCMYIMMWVVKKEEHAWNKA
jgi:hypothetical protein